MAIITVEAIFESITLVFALMALVIILVVRQRMGKKLRSSHTYLFLAMSAYIVSKIIRVFNGFQMQFDLIPFWWTKLLAEIMGVAFIMLFVVGEWKMHFSIVDASNNVEKRTKK